MVKTTKNTKLRDFLIKYRKTAITLNIIIWIVFALSLLTYNAMTADHITKNEMIERVNEKCYNNITIPQNKAFKIKFTYNELTNNTICEVITK